MNQETPNDIEQRTVALTERLRKTNNFIITIDGEVEAAGVAQLLGLSTKTLRNWRSESMGPPSRTLRGIALYSIRNFICWIDEEHDAGRPVLAIASTDLQDAVTQQ